MEKKEKQEKAVNAREERMSIVKQTSPHERGRSEMEYKGLDVARGNMIDATAISQLDFRNANPDSYSPPASPMNSPKSYLT